MGERRAGALMVVVGRAAAATARHDGWRVAATAHLRVGWPNSGLVVLAPDHRRRVPLWFGRALVTAAPFVRWGAPPCGGVAHRAPPLDVAAAAGYAAAGWGGCCGCWWRWWGRPGRRFVAGSVGDRGDRTPRLAIPVASE